MVPNASPIRPLLLVILLGLLISAGLSARDTDQQPVSLPDPLAAGWKGQKVCEELTSHEEHRVLRCTFPPGVGHERHFHAKHFGYTVEGGRMQITDASGTREVDIEAHSTWENDGVAWHEVENVGETTAIFLIVEPRD